MDLPNEKPPFNGRGENVRVLPVLPGLIGVSKPLETSSSRTFLTKTVRKGSSLGAIPGGMRDVAESGVLHF